MKNFIWLLLLALAFATACTKQASNTAAVNATPPAFSSIQENELRRDLFILAGDSMRGKRAGTPDELRAAAWVAERARLAGLEPAGEDGTYFQFFPLRRIRVGDNARLEVNGKAIRLWQDAWVTAPVESKVDGSVVWLKSLADTVGKNFKNKILAMPLQAPNPLPVKGMSLWGYRYILAAVRQQSNLLRNQGAAAIMLVSDSVAENNLAFAGHGFEEGTYQLAGTPVSASRINVPVILVRKALASTLQNLHAKVTADISLESFIYPSINVVAKAAGSDPVLRQEHVLFSGHHDHDGVGVPIAGDSIWNGADDNASVSVALLAIGRAWKNKPGKRSALFVWHGAEERGLWGSRWYAEHPTVKKETIVAVLNGDMIGRNAPDSAALLGAIPPHRNSTALVEMALQANKQFTRFNLDTSRDEQWHPEGWYFRSDHLPYARAGIPSIFFTTLLHPDYHTPRDEAQRIDYAKLTRMTRWMYATGWLISNTSQRPTVEPGFKLEH